MIYYYICPNFEKHFCCFYFVKFFNNNVDIFRIGKDFQIYSFSQLWLFYDGALWRIEDKLFLLFWTRYVFFRIHVLILTSFFISFVNLFKNDMDISNFGDRLEQNYFKKFAFFYTLNWMVRRHLEISYVRVFCKRYCFAKLSHFLQRFLCFPFCTFFPHSYWYYFHSGLTF